MQTSSDIAAPAAEPDARTNMFVLATIASRSASGPVKIRNMSAGGAMIEGASLPAAGDRFELHRGANRVAGEVVWCIDGKADLRFDGRADVAEWMPGAHAGQHRVDQVFNQIKASPAAPNPPVCLSSTLESALAPSQLRRLARDLESLADDLADDLSIVTRFATKLQTLDLASQVLRKLSDQDRTEL